MPRAQGGVFCGKGSQEKAGDFAGEEKGGAVSAGRREGAADGQAGGKERNKGLKNEIPQRKGGGEKEGKKGKKTQRCGLFE